MTTTVTAHRAEPVARQEPRPSRRDVILAGGGLAVVLLLGLVVTPLHGWTAAELTVVEWVSAHHVPVLDAVARGIDTAFSPVGALLLLVALCAGVAGRDGTRRGVLVFLIAGASWLGSWVLKAVVHRARPDVALLVNPPAVDLSFAYPSGHTVFATVFVLTALLAFDRRRCRWSVMVGVLLVAATAASRVYLGVHYPSDVLAGVVYAICAVVLVTAAVQTPPAHRLLTALHLHPLQDAAASRPSEGEHA